MSTKIPTHLQDTVRVPQNRNTHSPSTTAGDHQTGSSSPQDQSPSDRNHTTDATRLAVHLLIALCFGALASFSIAPYLLAQTPPQRPVASQYSNGQCLAQSQDIKYLQQPAKQEPPLPAYWSRTGESRQEFDLAQACAAEFTIAYETFNINQPQSLLNATSMLSADGKKHFFEGAAGEPKDIRADVTWQAQARKEQLQQSAQAVNKAQLQVVNQGGTIAVLFTVTYKLMTTIYGKRSTQQKQLLVYVEAVPTAPAGKALATPTNASTGWRVFDWHAVN